MSEPVARRAEHQYPQLVMKATRAVRRDLTRWAIYSEPVGRPYSYVINGERLNLTTGYADSLSDARAAVADYYLKLEVPM